MVMYLGKVAEIASREQLYTRAEAPVHGRAALRGADSRTRTLGRQRKQIVLEGDVPSPINPPTGCRFHPRCPRFHAGTCDVDEPLLVRFGPGTWPRATSRSSAGR